MKIKRIHIQNYRNLSNFKMEKIPDLIVLTGINGCGKSSVLEAIGNFKSIIAPYIEYIPRPDEMTQQEKQQRAQLIAQFKQNLGNKMRNIVKKGEDMATIEIEFEFFENEKEKLNLLIPDLIGKLNGKSRLKGKVVIKKNGDVNIEMVDPHLKEILVILNPEEEMGHMEYFPPHRMMSPQIVQNVQINKNDQQRKWEKIFQPETKFSQIKMTIAEMAILDSGFNKSVYISGLKNIFQDFFIDKEFKGVIYNNKTGIWDFPVKTINDIVDIDDLSDGEKEIIMTYANIHKNKFNNSIILIDEPELHLNASLERKIIDHLKGIVELNNQIWIATHSPEVINSVDYDFLFNLNPRVENHAISISNERDFYQLLEDLGVTKSQMVREGMKFVFVEGPTDETFLRLFAKKINKNNNFDSNAIEFVSLRGYDRYHLVRSEILEKINSPPISFFLILDKHQWTDEEISKLEADIGHNNYYILEKYEIENYLIDKKAIIKIIENKIEETKTEKTKAQPYTNDEFNTILSEIIDRYKKSVFIKRITHKLTSEVRLTRNEVEEIISSLDNINKDTVIEKVYFKVSQKVEAGIGTDKIKSKVEQGYERIEKEWEEKPIDICPGKEVLRDLRNRIFQDYNIQISNTDIVNYMDEAEIPLKEIIKSILDIMNANKPITVN